MPASRTGSKIVFEAAAIVLVIALYLYPSFKARAQLGPSVLPPIFAPDLSMYLNLSQIATIDDGRVMNPYYRIPVPTTGAGYLKFRLAPRLFGSLNRLLDNRTWFALLLWNAFWWTLLCIVAKWLFDRFLPARSPTLVLFGLFILMLFNFGVLKTLLLAWVHLPSLAGFADLQLPFMRAFIPVIPCALVLAYLGLQMEALRRSKVIVWIAMAALQLFALAIFPYATVLMAGLTAVSLLGQVMRLGWRETWRIPLLYGVTCGLLDFAFLWHGSLGFYDNRSSAIHFQPQLLPHLIGGNWLLLVGVTVAVAFAKPLVFELKWPLVGLGATNAVLMLGDVIVPSTAILLSHHASRFLHMTIATLTPFLIAAALSALPRIPRIAHSIVGFVLVFTLLNGALLAAGTYQNFLQPNREIVELSQLQHLLNLTDSDLLIARSETVDDRCGWVVLMSPPPVLFCTDAEVMLTPQQNRDVHRFRQAVYLYLTGENSDLMQRALAGPNPSSLVWKLGYWAEAISPSAEERKQGIHAIQSDVVPWLERVENHDVEVSRFFRKFRRIIVIDSRQDHTFAADRLEAFLNLEGQQNFDDFSVLLYSSR